MTTIISQETAHGIARVLPNHGHTVDCAFCAAVGSDLAALADENEALRQEIRKFQQWIHAAINDSDPEADCNWLCAQVCAGPCEGFPVGPIGFGSDGGDR